MLTERELAIQRMTLRKLDEKKRAEIRADVEARWPQTQAFIDQIFEERMVAA